MYIHLYPDQVKDEKVESRPGGGREGGREVGREGGWLVISNKWSGSIISTGALKD